MLFIALATVYVSHSKDVKPAEPLSVFPMQIGEWSGSEIRFDNNVYDLLKADDTLLRVYTDPAHRRLELFLSFYRHQRQGRQIHSPKNCMPGAGWMVSESTQEVLKISNCDSLSFSATRLLLQKGNEKMVMLYWFRSGGMYVASEFSQRFQLVLDSIFRHRTDGAFIRLMTRIPAGSEEEGIRSLKRFAELIVPELNKHLPQ
jgi:EpsI family protein